MSAQSEDAAKARVPKRHPHQTEIIVVLRGALTLHQGSGGSGSDDLLGEGECAVVPKGACHSITGVDDQDAVFLFVKTNPSQQPREEPCDPGRDDESTAEGRAAEPESSEEG